MNNELPARPNPPLNRGGKYKYLLIALAPMPIGVFMFVAKALESSYSRIALPLVGILSLVCCIYGTVGMFGGYHGKPGPMPWINGILLGIVLFVVEALIVLFVGCAVTFKPG